MPDRDADMRRDYEFAERLNTKKGWDDFLAKHKSGSYVELARDRVARLEPPAPAPAPRPQPPAPSRPEVTAEPPKPPPAPQPPPQRPPGPSRCRKSLRLSRRISSCRSSISRSSAIPTTATPFSSAASPMPRRRSSQAIKDFDQAIRLNPKDAEAYNNRCWARAMIGDLQVALRDCNKSLRLKPNFVDALDSRGLVNLKIGLPNSAISDYNAALKINPRHATALFGRGKARLRSGDTNGGNADIACRQGAPGGYRRGICRVWGKVNGVAAESRNEPARGFAALRGSRHGR